jgi:O-antigen/teichoic acid export membrane protein
LGEGVIAAFVAWFIRKRSYVEIALNRATASIVLATSQIGLGLLGWGPLGLLLGVVLSVFAAAGRLIWRARRGRDGGFPSVSWARMTASARRYRRFPLMSAPARLINSIGLQAPLLLITVLFGTTVGGQFALAHRVMALPLALVSTAIGNVYLAEASRVRRDEPADLRRLYLRTTRSIALLATGPVILAALVSPFVFGIIFGPEWREAGVFAAILAPMYLLRLMTNPTHSTLDVLERQDLHLIRELIRLLLVVGAMVAVWAIGASAVVTVVAIMVVGVATYALYGYLTWRAIVAHDERLAKERGAGEDHPQMADD